jgi:hypothetical protein
MATNTLQATISAAAFGTVFWQVVRRYGVRSTSTLLFGFGGIVTLLFLLLDSHEVYAQSAGLSIETNKNKRNRNRNVLYAVKERLQA